MQLWANDGVSSKHGLSDVLQVVLCWPEIKTAQVNSNLSRHVVCKKWQYLIQTKD